MHLPAKRLYRAMSLCLCLCLCLCLWLAHASAATSGAYRVLATVPGADGSWDYASIDPVARRLYLAHNGVSVLDLDSLKWLPTIAPGTRGGGVLPVPALHRIIAVDGNSNTLKIYDTVAQKLVASVPTGKSPDGMAYDAKTGLAAVMTDREQGAVTLVDVARHARVSTVPVGGDLEFPVSDNKGTLFINGASRNELVVLDLRSRKVVRRVALKGCEEPHGLAYDAPTGLLVSSCENTALVVRARDAVIVATLKIDPGADAAMDDAPRRQVLIPCGDTGVLEAIDLSQPSAIHVVQLAKSAVGARTGAVDVSTGKVYLPTADLAPVVPPAHWPLPKPGTFRILVLGPG